MRKFAAILALSAVISGTASAVDMGGKIGFGLGSIPGTSILEPCYLNMRMALTKSIMIEPSLIYMNASDDYQTYLTNLSIDSTKFTTTYIGIGCRALFTLLNREKGNLYGTFYFDVTMPTDVEDDYSDDPTEKCTWTESGMGYDVLLGLAFEHFITSHFSVCIISEAGYSGYSFTEKAEAGTTTITGEEITGTQIDIGNTNFGLFFYWYL